MKLSLGLSLCLAAALAACSFDAREEAASESDALRSITTEQALAELDQVGASIRGFYGPLKLKEQLLGFDLDRALAEARAEIAVATTEGERIGPIMKLLGSLKDGHVGYSFTTRSDESVDSGLPFMLTPLDGKYVVFQANVPSIARGDTLVSIDGLTAGQLEEKLLPYFGSGMIGAQRHTVGLRMTSRAFYLPRDLQPAGDTAHVVLLHEDGSEYAVDLPWTFRKGMAGQVLPPRPTPTAALPATDLAFSTQAADVIAAEAQATRLEMGASMPYYLTPEVRAALGVVDVGPKRETLTSFGVSVPEGATGTTALTNLRAFKLKRDGKTILIVRIPSFSAANNDYPGHVAWLAAVLKDNLAAPSVDGAELPLADTPADVVVADVTHNPGGSVPYVQGLARLFLSAPAPGFIQANHADRVWLGMNLAVANIADSAAQPILLDRMKAMESAIDDGRWLAPFAPLTGSVQGPTAPLSVEAVAGLDLLSPYPLVHWDRPVLVLHDDLSGSGGDAFPMILQNSGAKTFGSTTMGLGGSVSPMMQSSITGATLSLTRGLFGVMPTDGTAGPKLIENAGVRPDYPWTATISDFRARYVGFATAFGDLSARLVRTGPITTGPALAR